MCYNDNGDKMDTMQKLKILADSAKYDVSCSSSGSNRKNKGGLGNAAPAGICHSFSADGRCVSLLKMLMTNVCIFDCKYCVNRCSNDVERAVFSPEEVAELTVNFYKRNYIEGLFLSSGIIKDADYTMSRIYEAVKLLREKYHFYGYIHVKTIPGCNSELIDKVGKLVDRMSINIELPSASSLQLLAPNKNKEKIVTPMKYVATNIQKNKKFVQAGQTTQMIVGASNDSDHQIMQLSEGMYKSLHLKRVYFSAYIGVNYDKLLPAVDTAPPLKRENRLYQADWLLRFYGFEARELLNESKPNFDYRLDPKCDWALSNFHLFPVEINKAPYEVILRIPGIGVLGANKIVKARKYHTLTFEDLKRMNIVLKRARYFITCSGKYFFHSSLFQSNIIKNALVYHENTLDSGVSHKQIELFGE